MNKKAQALVLAAGVCLLITALSITIGQKYWQFSGQIIGGISFPIGVLLLVEGIARRGIKKLTNPEEVNDKMESMLRSASNFALLISDDLSCVNYKMIGIIKQKVEQGVMFEIISQEIDQTSLQKFQDLLPLSCFNLHISKEILYNYGLLVDGKELNIGDVYFKRPSGAMVYFERCFNQYKQAAEKINT